MLRQNTQIDYSGNLLSCSTLRYGQFRLKVLWEMSLRFTDCYILTAGGFRETKQEAGKWWGGGPQPGRFQAVTPFQHDLVMSESHHYYFPLLPTIR